MDAKMMKTYHLLDSKKILQNIAVTVVATVIIAGCASTPPPKEQMAVSRAAVSSASKAGSGELAPVPLKSAMDKMDAAERAMTEKNYELAQQLAEQAQVDAQLAEATARSIKAQKAANALQEDNRVLRHEIDRNSK
jgi:Domain of unknown function (DUF4398)